MRTPKVYRLWKDANGDVTPFWQYRGEPRVPGCWREDGRLRPPAPAYEVKAWGLEHAIQLARDLVTVGQQRGIGIVTATRWKRNV